MQRYVINSPLNFVDPSGLDPITHGAARSLKDFADNYTNLRDANWVDADKYFHCKANCQSAKRGIVEDGFSMVYSELRELSDQYIKGDSAAQCNEDREANNTGRRGGRNNSERSCEDICKRYRPPTMPRKYDKTPTKREVDKISRPKSWRFRIF